MDEKIKKQGHFRVLNNRTNKEMRSLIEQSAFTSDSLHCFAMYKINYIINYLSQFKMIKNLENSLVQCACEPCRMYSFLFSSIFSFRLDF